MTERITVEAEATGETVGEARWAAVHELERRHPGLDRSSVTSVVISEGQRGLLGVGYEPARVVARAEVPAGAATRGGDMPAAQPEVSARPADPAAAAAVEVVEHILAGLGLEGVLDVDGDEASLVVTVHGPDLGLLIGKHGQTIDAVQYLANAIVHRRAPDSPAVVVDAEGYRGRRERTLTDIALRAADAARRRGDAIALEPMTAAERKIVHNCLVGVPDVVTASHGAEPHRHVVVSPADEPAEPADEAPA